MHGDGLLLCLVPSEFRTVDDAGRFQDSLRPLEVRVWRKLFPCQQRQHTQVGTAVAFQLDALLAGLQDFYLHGIHIGVIGCTVGAIGLHILQAPGQFFFE